jgi:hypothetical protein
VVYTKLILSGQKWILNGNAEVRYQIIPFERKDKK